MGVQAGTVPLDISVVIFLKIRKEPSSRPSTTTFGYIAKGCSNMTQRHVLNKIYSRTVCHSQKNQSKLKTTTTKEFHPRHSSGRNRPPWMEERQILLLQWETAWGGVCHQDRMSVMPPSWELELNSWDRAGPGNDGRRREDKKVSGRRERGRSFLSRRWTEKERMGKEQEEFKEEKVTRLGKESTVKMVRLGRLTCH